MIESCLDRHFILHLLWSDNIFQIRTYFAVSFKTSENKEQFFFVVPFFELFHEDRKNLYLCAPGWSERGRSLPFITPLPSCPRQRREEMKNGTLALFLFLLSLLLQTQNLLMKSLFTLTPRDPSSIRCHVSEGQEVTILAEKTVGPRVSCSFIA